MLNVSELFSCGELTQVVKCKTYKPTFINSGDAAGEVTMDTTERNIVVCAQPVQPKELEMLPEGMRTQDSVKFYSPQALTAASGDTDGVPTSFDVVYWGGMRYKVVKVWDWSNHGYWEAIGVNAEGLPA